MKLTVLGKPWGAGPEPLLPRLRVRGPGCGALLAIQIAILILTVRHVTRRELQPQPTARTSGGAGSGGADGGTDAASAEAAAEWPVTSDLNEWIQLPYAYTFRAPQSQCLLHPNGAPSVCRGRRCNRPRRLCTCCHAELCFQPRVCVPAAADTGTRGCCRC